MRSYKPGFQQEKILLIISLILKHFLRGAGDIAATNRRK